MFITKKKIKGRTYYYVVEGKRVKGKTKMRTVKYLGTVEKILSKFQ